MTEEHVKTSFRLPVELHRKAQEICKREDVTLSQVLRRLLKEWVKEKEKPPEE